MNMPAGELRLFRQRTFRLTCISGLSGLQQWRFPLHRPVPIGFFIGPRGQTKPFSTLRYARALLGATI